MLYSASNRIQGTVQSVTTGKVCTRVEIGLPSGETISSIISTESAHSLGIAVGSKAYAIIKATDVMVAVNPD